MFISIFGASDYPCTIIIFFSILEQLEQDKDTILSGIRALSQIFTMFSSHDTEIVDEVDFNDGISLLELNKESQAAVYQTYCQVHILLRDVINDFRIETPIYQSFDWRLDIEIASRSLHRRADPKFLCQLQTRKVNKLENNDNNNNSNISSKNNANENKKNDNENDSEKKVDTGKEDSKDEFTKDNDLNKNNNNQNTNGKNKNISIDKIETTLFECNFANLENTIKQLETALQEVWFLYFVLL